MSSKDLIAQAIIDDPEIRTTNYKNMVRVYYDLVTDIYRRDWDESFHFAIFSGSETLHEAIVATEIALANEGKFRPGMKILDIGCGIGSPALNISKYSGAHITGVNINERQIEIARQKAVEQGLSEQTEFVLADAMDMPFADESFDAIYTFEATCHMPDKNYFYQQCARVLRPGGIFLGQDWFCGDMITAQEHTTYVEPVCRYSAVPSMMSLAEFRKCLNVSGLEVETFGNIAERGNILRNWEILDNKLVRGIHGMFPWLIPPVLRMLTDGGYAILEGVKSGAVIIGYWRSRKLISL